MHHCESLFTKDIRLVRKLLFKRYMKTVSRARYGYFCELNCGICGKYSLDNVYKLCYLLSMRYTWRRENSFTPFSLGKRCNHNKAGIASKDVICEHEDTSQESKSKTQIQPEIRCEWSSINNSESPRHQHDIPSGCFSSINSNRIQLEEFEELDNDYTNMLYKVPAELSFHNYKYMEAWNDEAHPQAKDDDAFEEDVILNEDLDTGLEDFLASKNRDTEIDIDWISTQHSSDYRILKEVHKPIVMKLRPHYMKTFVSLETTLSLQKGICKKKPDLTFITEKISTNSINDYLESLIVNNYGWASTHQGSVIDKKLKDIVSSQLLLLEVFLNVKSLNLLILFFSRTKDLNMIKITLKQFLAMQIFPTIDTYNMILDCIRRLQDDGKINKRNLDRYVVPLVHRMKRTIYMTPFNITTYRELLQLLSDPDMKLGLLRQMASKNIPMQYYQTQTMEALYSVYGVPEKFQKLADLTVVLTCMDAESFKPDYEGMFSCLINKLFLQSLEDPEKLCEIMKLLSQHLNYVTPNLASQICYYFASSGQCWNSICWVNWYVLEIIGIHPNDKNKKEFNDRLAATLWPTLTHFDDMVITLRSRNIHVAVPSLRMFAKCLYRVCVTQNGYYLDRERIESIEKVLAEVVISGERTVSDFLLTDKLTLQEGSTCGNIMTALVWDSFPQIFVKDRSPVWKKFAVLLGYKAQDNYLKKRNPQR